MSSFVQPLTLPNESVGTLVPRRIMINEDVPNPFFVIEDEDVAEPKSNSAILYSKELVVHVIDSPIVISSTDKPVVGVLIVPATFRRLVFLCRSRP
ncbi:hypothetical protein CTI12_AA285820 [Artemisia annua]|uniref:Uncharacterized protein n=1 Tax=Artemisia annua TaxID=35608 RepID=A0A2U1N2L3_ARTAN|nr:hypothetical protein CTI12_AA285820 [Artemisia annua]